MKEDLEETVPVYRALCILMHNPQTSQRLASLMPAILQVLTCARAINWHRESMHVPEIGWCTECASPTGVVHAKPVTEFTTWHAIMGSGTVLM